MSGPLSRVPAGAGPGSRHRTPAGSAGSAGTAGTAPEGWGSARSAGTAGTAPEGWGSAPVAAPSQAAHRAPDGTAPVRPGGALRGVPQPRPTDRFAEMLVAVLSGQRPVHAMLRHSAGQAYDELIRLAERGPLRTRGARPVVRDIGWFVPREGAIEAFARIGAGDRLRAMAFRLERGRDLRWRCTAVELGGPR
ncbi:Rv3235 family protein [Streptomyces cellulosae]